MSTPIGIDIKKKCVEMYEDGMMPSQIYREYFRIVHPQLSFDSFKSKLYKWRNKLIPTDETLIAGTYDGFSPHGATVQVNGKGEIVQSWIKQSAEKVDWDDIIERFTDKVEPIDVECISTIEPEEAMLEIPLFDMHFGVANFVSYGKSYIELKKIIQSTVWDEINIILGQDLIHTNDMRGHTAKGTNIQQIDVPGAWQDAWDFWSNIIIACLGASKRVNVRYSKGNHDECISWCFLKALQAKFPKAKFDDSLKSRKAITWNGCFIGYGHLEYTNQKNKLFRDFVIDFPRQFASASVREIHAGHLHSESIDEGVMVRRLASGVPVDNWSDNNGYASAHKRFQVFKWTKNKLSAIYYI